jgi:hypothetical protein
MHKKGVEYYFEIIKNAYDVSSKIIENAKSRGQMNQLYNYSFEILDKQSVIPIITELNGHMINTLNHINSEDNVVKKFMEGINKNLDHNLDNPHVEKLYRLMREIKELEEGFKRISTGCKRIINYLSNREGKDADSILNTFYELRSDLEVIHYKSKNISSSIANIISEIQKEKELIQKEEFIFGDFQRNLMSWF